MIVLEGPDRSGKSSLALALAARLGYRVEHAGLAWRDGLTAARIEAESRGYVVRDRWWPSELAYSHATGRPSVMTEDDVAAARAATRAARALVVLTPLTPEAFAAQERLDRPEAFAADVRRAANAWYWEHAEQVVRGRGDGPLTLTLPVGVDASGRVAWSTSRRVELILNAYGYARDCRNLKEQS